MHGREPLLRMAAATSLLLSALLLPGILRGARSGGTGTRAGRGAGPSCFEVVGAVRRPGLRCGPGLPAASVLPLPPCDTPEALEGIRVILERCPVGGKRLVLAPRVPGGPCAPRLAPLGASVRLMLGLPVEIRSAAREDLEALPGVGPATAGRILAVRDRLRSADDLVSIPGIGEARARGLRRLLSFTPHGDPTCP